MKNNEKLKTQIKKAFYKAAIFLKKLIMLIFNPHFVLCFLIAWMITNGWCYVLIGLGTILKNTLLLAIGGGYAALLWLPFTPEKIITVTIALFLLKRIYPDDKKTLGQLHELYEKAKRQWADYSATRKTRKSNGDNQKDNQNDNQNNTKNENQIDSQKEDN